MPGGRQPLGLYAGLLLAALVVSLPACGTAGSARESAGATRAASLPQTMLWAWERPTDLTHLTSPRVGVAYLAGTITLRDGDFTTRPRLQPLSFSPDCTVVAVVRIEPGSGHARPLRPEVAVRMTAEILLLADRPLVSGLQIDFDAAVSDRPFYAKVLSELRQRMPANWPLSVTALASWCLGDPWIRGLPIDEAVPMLFRMGSDASEVRARLGAGHDFTFDVCRSSIGVSTDEWDPKLPSRRRYLFNPGGWTRD